jgi:hypothetical protein
VSLRDELLALFAVRPFGDDMPSEGIDVYGTGQPERLVDAIVALLQKRPVDGWQIVNGWIVEELPPELQRAGSPFTGPEERFEPLLNLKTLPGYWSMVESWVDLMAGQFADDLQYDGAEVIGRLRAMQHAAEPHEPGVPCPVCEDGAGL